MQDEFQSQVTREVLKRVRQLEIRTNRLIDERLMGSYRSIFKGQGIEFEELREYAIGDDIRSINWNITAKTERPFVKKFREDRELKMMLVVDVSGSLDFGSAHYSKREVITELASLLAFSAIRNNDKVGLLLFSDRIEKFIPPMKGHKHVLRLIRELLFFEPQGKRTQIGDAMHYLNNILRGHAIVFLLSDFIQAKINDVRELTQALEITNRRHDLVCLRVQDVREQQLPDVGLISLEDQETGEVFTFNTHAAPIRNIYPQHQIREQQAIDTHLRRAGIDVLTIRTDEDYLGSVDRFLRQRARMH
ncbi:MAG: DUF58 domain-containing protein [Opitutales bacterium]|nr:DUF58 domain-containing protein [Opitutales bacterium]